MNIPFILAISDRRPSSRLLTKFFAFWPAFLILSISRADLFCLVFSVTVLEQYEVMP